MLELIHSVLSLILGTGAIYCAHTAWYLTTPQGKYMWNKIACAERECRQRNRVIHDWINGKNEA
jgi:hypothetical protein